MFDSLKTARYQITDFQHILQPKGTAVWESDSHNLFSVCKFYVVLIVECRVYD